MAEEPSAPGGYRVLHLTYLCDLSTNHYKWCSQPLHLFVCCSHVEAPPHSALVPSLLLLLLLLILHILLLLLLLLSLAPAARKFCICTRRFPSHLACINNGACTVGEKAFTSAFHWMKLMERNETKDAGEGGNEQSQMKQAECHRAIVDNISKQRNIAVQICTKKEDGAQVQKF